MHKIKSGIRNISAVVGIDRAIIYTILARTIQAGGGAIMIIFIAKFLNKTEQGYYFTFGSILAIQVFFELGLSGIITQFVAHEKAHLEWENQSELVGSAESLSRLASLLQFCVKWFFIIACILVFVLILVGYIFFNKYTNNNVVVNWQLPWIILSFSTACSLMLSPILAFFEGLGKVKEVAKMRLAQQISLLFFLFLLLATGFKLFASPVASLLTFAIVPIWILFSYKKVLLKNIWNQKGKWKVNYRLEIFPYQWRIALSWVSGYFIFQLFNPVLFATEGPVVAGQMGMTLAALNGVLSISLSWINTKVPLFSSYISKKEYGFLDAIFNKTLKQANLICGICLCVLIFGVSILKHYHYYLGDRFLPLLPLVLLCVATFVNQFNSALATYLRCHKQEPFLIQSIALGVLIAISTFALGKFFGLIGIVIGYSSIVLFLGMPWSLLIFRTKKELWHN